ncbi:MAG: hypothetical protein MRY83_14820 [Flavobacteriales bacterium]|nr:hypothetical protein [Flavobacteriales bacterium]
MKVFFSIIFTITILISSGLMTLVASLYEADITELYELIEKESEDKEDKEEKKNKDFFEELDLSQGFDKESLNSYFGFNNWNYQNPLSKVSTPPPELII